MRRWTLAAIAAVSAIALTQIASAADLPRKAPAYTPPPPPAYSWTGFYIGGNFGYSSGKAETHFNADAITVNTTSGPVTIPGFVGSDPIKPQGIIGGGQIGYNWQFSPNWVVGLEADIQASGEKASKSIFDGFAFTNAAPVVTVSGTTVTDVEAKISWFGTARGRIGYTWDGVMIYATGGLAYGEVKVDGTRTVSGTLAGVVPFSISRAVGHSHVNTGWTVGGGIEGAIFDSRNWTYKLEYLYIDLGSLDDPDAILAVTSVTGGQTFTHTHFTDNVVRLGVNYKFY
jgi:outer membrane immunogenic protein